jgi:hypothetical protein
VRTCTYVIKHAQFFDAKGQELLSPIDWSAVERLEPAVLCDLPITHYVMATDDDSNSYRKYDSFCPEHQARFDALKDAMSEDDE